MSEWQKSVENRAKHTTAMYILEDGSGAVSAARSARHRRQAADMTFGLFCIMMGLAMCILSAGLFLAAEGTLFGSAAAVVIYLVMGISLLVRGIAGLV